jgi:hypothetical protein
MDTAECYRPLALRLNHEFPGFRAGGRRLASSGMSDQFPSYRVEIQFSGPVPARQVARASGVSEVEVHGTILRCRVLGSVQPFLEALRGYEVLRLESGISLAFASTSQQEKGNAGND